MALRSATSHSRAGLKGSVFKKPHLSAHFSSTARTSYVTTHNDPESRRPSRINRTMTPAEGEDTQRRIHILGIGNVGIFVAHALRGIPDSPPITLLLHQISYAREWEKGKQELTLVTDGQAESRSGFDMELAIPPRRKHHQTVSVAEAERLEDPANSSTLPHTDIQPLADDTVFHLNEGPPITNLIVTVKAPSTVSALLAVKHRLSSNSTILFLQNGMGIIEDVNEHVFPDPATRPNYLLGINSHGLHSKASFTTKHAGFGTISLGMPVDRSLEYTKPDPDSLSTAGETAPDLSKIDMAPSSRYLFRTIIRTPVFAAVGFPPVELMKLQLDKLAVNCVINPLTSLMDCRNGSLLYNMGITRSMRLILSEVSSIFIRLPELENLPNVSTRFSSERLETITVGVANRTGRNISSMLADLRSGKRTEIDYINGYVVKRGQEMGIHAGFNYMMHQLVRGKHSVILQDSNDELPMVERGRWFNE